MDATVDTPQAGPGRGGAQRLFDVAARVALASTGRQDEAEQQRAAAADTARAAGQPELARELERQLVIVRQGWPPPPGPAAN